MGRAAPGRRCDDRQCVETNGFEFDRMWTHGFGNPWGIAVDKDANVDVADSGNNRIQKFTSTGTPVATWGEFGIDIGKFNQPAGVTVNPVGVVYVADSKNHRIQKLTSLGVPVGTWRQDGSDPGQFSVPQGIAYNPQASLLYIADNSHTRVQVFSDSTYVTELPLTPFAEYRAVTVAPDGTVSVVNTSGGHILKLTSGGDIERQIGSQGAGEGQFKEPIGIAVDSEGNVKATSTYPNSQTPGCRGSARRWRSATCRYAAGAGL